MVEHRLTARLACHHCGHVMPRPPPAPNARRRTASSPAAPASSGSPTRSRALLPEARAAIITSDTIWSPAKAAEFVNRMEAATSTSSIGTQLVTKGYHFPNLTLVGVVDADLGLAGGDLRAAERSFQQMRQVAGACRSRRQARPRASSRRASRARR